jgi:methionyl aminopeptidase
VAEALEIMAGPYGRGWPPSSWTGLAEKHIRKQGGLPAFKGYRGFPASICASINEEVVHGIPGLRRLKEGDIISIDVGVTLQGLFRGRCRHLPGGGNRGRQKT